MNFAKKSLTIQRTPLVVAFLLVLVGGIFLLNRADAQTRDTTRKHHLEDIEQSLYYLRDRQGTYPPYDQAEWCGSLDSKDAEPIRQAIRAGLSEAVDKYANPDKPFPRDPRSDRAPRRRNDQRQFSYFYWKRSPASFELYAKLEADQNGDRSTTSCGSDIKYDYGLTSVWRESI